MLNIKKLKKSLKFITSLKVFIFFLIMFAFFITTANNANAAVISGSIYDLSLQKESDAVVEINTLPKQLLVSKDGDYMFNVGLGNYTLHSYTATSEASESIIISDDGNYTFDIILEDKSIYSNDNLFLDEKNLTVSLDFPNDPAKNSSLPIILGLLLLVIIIIISVYLLLYPEKYFFRNSNIKYSSKLQQKESEKSKKSEELKSDKNVKTEKEFLGSLNVDSSKDIKEILDKYDVMILNIIKKEKRTTQKDIRSQVPLSEAKISLVLSDLEDKGMIRKIKKGRGNILIFIKD